MNNISDQQLREFIDKKINELGKERTIEYLYAGDYPKELKDRAINMIQGPSHEDIKSSLAENGDLSDLQM